MAAWTLAWSLLAIGGPAAVGAGSALATDQTLTLRPRARIETTLGDVVIELYGDRAPATVANFAKYAEAKFYDGTVFHRVIKATIIQGGAMTTDLTTKTEGLRDPVKNEWRNGIKNDRGTIALARQGNQPDSGRASFFINVADNDYLDKPVDGAGYAVFGTVVEGMDTVDKIRDTPVTTSAKIPDHDAVVPQTPVVIKSIRFLNKFDYDKAKPLESMVEALGKEAEEQAKAAVVQKIQDSIKKIELDAKAPMIKTASGLQYVDRVAGTGLTPGPEDFVTVHYRGTFPDGTEFDNSRTNQSFGGKPAEFQLNKMVKGFAEGVGSMKVGGTRILVIPPDLGFGARGRPGVPGNATLIFEIELLAIGSAPAAP